MRSNTECSRADDARVVLQLCDADLRQCRDVAAVLLCAHDGLDKLEQGLALVRDTAADRQNFRLKQDDQAGNTG